MNNQAWIFFEKAVQDALVRNGLTDPFEALRKLLWLLRERHRAAVTAWATRAYREDFELPDPHASTVAESIKELATSMSCNHRREAEGNDASVAHTAESITSGMDAIANVLRELIPLWDFEAMEDAAAVAARVAE